MRLPRSFFPFLAIVAVVLTCAQVDRDMRLWEKKERVIEWDVHGYYGYLPMVFIYDDIRLEKGNYQVGENEYLFWPEHLPDGRKVIKYTMGTAYLYAPFFFIAHWSAPWVGAAPTGFSPHYKIWLQVGGLCYLLMGLLLLRWILRRAGFSEATVAIGLLLVGGATNLLCYSSHSSTMPHVHGFFLVTAFIALTMRWYSSPTWGRALLLGAVFGVLTLMRPTNAMIGLFFALYGALAFPERWRLWRAHLGQFYAAALLAALMWLPQLLYWHATTGEFFFYSYQQEHFFFGHPHIIDGLFSFRKGWLVYTPVMAFALVGVFLLNGELARWRTAVITVLLLHVYITFSWWCWWYGGTYGQRAMIEIYPLLAVPLCAVVERLRRANWAWRAPAIAVGAFFIWLNIFQTYQFEEHSLHHDAMSRELYFKQFGKLKPIPDFDALLDFPDYDRARSTGY
ncbi:MAG TPA: hypothetical protein VHL57_02335 [Flavobacteriales bacterium]|jgi:MFS family permease|nr:hypothetical protein [Flavobacteriales bacterium]